MPGVAGNEGMDKNFGGDQMTIKKLEEIKCDLCGNNNSKLVGFVNIPDEKQHIFSVKKLKIVQCKKCGLVYTNPRPSKHVLKEYYDMIYSKYNTRNIQEEILVDKRLICCAGDVTCDPRFCKRLLKDINHLANEKGKMLDVGCGLGRFIKFAQDNGWQVFGQEFSDESVKSIQNKYKLNVQTGDLRDLNFPKDYFEVVIMLNVIEHLADPFEYLDEIYRILKKKGIIYLSTPNVFLSKQYIELEPLEPPTKSF
jgi:ubiquinone/menaquinone biosynthesis C-methylase UbiE/predicted nucleic-acid-binding Zn-ribbon protein